MAGMCHLELTVGNRSHNDKITWLGCDNLELTFGNRSHHDRITWQRCDNLKLTIGNRSNDDEITWHGCDDLELTFGLPSIAGPSGPIAPSTGFAVGGGDWIITENTSNK